MTLFEIVRQAALVAGELAALLTVTPALAAAPNEHVATSTVPQIKEHRLRFLHGLTSALELGSLRPIALLRVADLTEPADDEEPGCGGVDEADDADDGDVPSPRVNLEIDEAIADLSLRARRPHDPS